MSHFIDCLNVLPYTPCILGVSPGQDINNPLASIPSVFTVHNKTKSNYKSPPRRDKGDLFAGNWYSEKESINPMPVKPLRKILPI